MQVTAQPNIEITSDIYDLIGDLECSALILSRDLKVIEKNKKAATSFPGLRKGRRIGNLLSPAGKALLMKSRENRIFYTEVSKNGAVHNAMAVCYGEIRLLIIRPVGFDAHKSLDGIYANASGYDSVIPAPIIGNGSPQQLRKYLSAAILGFDEVFKKPRFTSFFNVLAVLNNIRDFAFEIAPELRERILIIGNEGDFAAVGSEKDFSVALSSLFAFSLAHAFDGNLLVNISEAGQKIHLELSFISNDDIEELRSVRRKKIYEPFSENEFRLHLVRLVSDGNLWDFSGDIIDDGRFVFKLSLPKISADVNCVLRDVSSEFLRKIISAFLPFDMF